MEITHHPPENKVDKVRMMHVYLRPLQTAHTWSCCTTPFSSSVLLTAQFPLCFLFSECTLLPLLPPLPSLHHHCRLLTTPSRHCELCLTSPRATLWGSSLTLWMKPSGLGKAKIPLFLFIAVFVVFTVCVYAAWCLYSGSAC